MKKSLLIASLALVSVIGCRQAPYGGSAKSALQPVDQNSQSETLGESVAGDSSQKSFGGESKKCEECNLHKMLEGQTIRMSSTQKYISKDAAQDLKSACASIQPIISPNQFSFGADVATDACGNKFSVEMFEQGDSVLIRLHSISKDGKVAEGRDGTEISLGLFSIVDEQTISAKDSAGRVTIYKIVKPQST